MHVHFIAVAGTGMGSLAGLFKAAGHEVSGSDVAFYPPMGPALERWGIRLSEGFDPVHLDPRPDLVIVGNVCRPWNPEARAAIDGGLRVTSMAHALADHMLPGTSPLVVGGTHGKTTTSALCALLLDRAGLEPGFLVGGLPRNFEESFRIGRNAPQPLRSRPFVIEGDEYDTAFFEKTPKFWHYRPEVGIITSIEHDHIDIYPDEASYLAAFRGFCERLPEQGLLVAHAADPKVVALAGSSARSEVAWYALAGAETHGVTPQWTAQLLRTHSAEQVFEVKHNGQVLGSATTTLAGEYNVANALAALAAVCQGYGVPWADAARALPTFQGVRRRQELIGEPRGIRVYDDFAHHPTAVRETLRGLRERHPGSKLWAVYEARSATACRKLHQQAYVEGFEAADRVLFAPLGRPDIAAGERLDLETLAQSLRARGQKAETTTSVEQIIALLCAEATAGDTIALLSNGSFGGIHPKLLGALAGS